MSENEQTGGVSLTPREIEVLALVAQGLSNHDAGERLFVSRRTVDFHLSNVYAKLGVHTRMHAVREAERRGLLPPSP